MNIHVPSICDLHQQTVADWHNQEIANSYHGFLQIVCAQHEQNFRLWHQEDIARSPDVSNAEMAAVKRAIDKLNQQRNDLIEQLDDALIECLAVEHVTPWQGARLNSETPGSVIDRLSILSLRLYHMHEQANRADATQEHIAKVHARLQILNDQHHDLSHSLTELLNDLFAGRKRLKVYRQFKMYNDPTMNPYLYSAKKSAA
jgi:cell division protein FtsB